MGNFTVTLTILASQRRTANFSATNASGNNAAFIPAYYPRPWPFRVVAFLLANRKRAGVAAPVQFKQTVSRGMMYFPTAARRCDLHSVTAQAVIAQGTLICRPEPEDEMQTPEVKCATNPANMPFSSALCRSPYRCSLRCENCNYAVAYQLSTFDPDDAYADCYCHMAILHDKLANSRSQREVISVNVGLPIGKGLVGPWCRARRLS